MNKSDFKTTDTYKHLLRINSSLWKNKGLGNASLMVGAGFSMNSKAIDDGSRMPSWDQLGESILDKLYPETLKCNETRKELLKRYSGSSGTVELAGEYSEFHSENDLNLLIENSINDNAYPTTTLHEEVLKLPWSDVFTTNYDTLLEKALRNNIGKRYELITKIKDIPNSVQPRIFKLHGSIPDSQPYIITEEQYRKYPELYAPFVNSVQQSMMENILCLIGFSGRDPNFLKWTGWINDNLKDNAPVIYLIGVFDNLTSSQRLLLKTRNVEIVNLLDIDEISSGQHDKAISFLMDFLNLHKKEYPKDWLKVDHSQTTDFKTLKIISKIETKSYQLTHQNTESLTKNDYLKIEATWEHDKKSFFNWPHLHQDLNQRLYNQTAMHIDSLIKNINNAPRTFLRLLAWRLDLGSVPILTNWYEIFENELSKKIEKEDEPILLYLLSDDRFCKENEKHNKHIKQLEKVTSDSINLNYLKLRFLLEDGQYSKAGLLFNSFTELNEKSIEYFLICSWYHYQVDQFQEAEEASLSALQMAREILSQQKNDSPFFHYLENIAQYQLFHIEQKMGKWPDNKLYAASQTSKEVYSDIIEVRESIQKSLNKSISSLKKTHEEKTNFDTGTTSKSITFSTYTSFENSAFLSLYQLSVRSYLQFGFFNKSGGDDAIKSSTLFNEMSFINLLVIAKTHKSTKNTLSRYKVSSLQTSSISFWIINLKTRITQIILTLKENKNINPMLSTLYNDLDNSLEIFSRLIYRSKFEDVSPLMLALLDEINQSKILQSSLTTPEIINSFFRRFFTFYDDSKIQQFLPMIADYKTKEEGLFHNNLRDIVDPIHFVFGVKRNFKLTADLTSAIDRLIQRAQNCTKANENLTVKIYEFYINDLLSKEQINNFSEVLWKAGSSDLNSLFTARNNAHLLLYTPNPKNIDEKEIIKSKIKDLKPVLKTKSSYTSEEFRKTPIGSHDHIVPFFSTIMSVSRNIFREKELGIGLIEWNDEELDILLKISLDMWENEKGLMSVKNSNGPFSLGDVLTLRYYNIAHCIAVNIAPFCKTQSSWNKIHNLYLELEINQIPATILTPYLYNKNLITLDQLEKQITSSLTSNHKLIQNDAFLALEQWACLRSLDEKFIGISDKVFNMIIAYFYRTSSIASHPGYENLSKVLIVDGKLGFYHV